MFFCFSGVVNFLNWKLVKLVKHDVLIIEYWMGDLQIIVRILQLLLVRDILAHHGTFNFSSIDRGIDLEYAV